MEGKWQKKLRKQQNDSQIGDKNSENREKTQEMEDKNSENVQKRENIEALYERLKIVLTWNLS